MRGNNVITGNVIRVSIWVLLVGLLMSALTLANMPEIAEANSDATKIVTKTKEAKKPKTVTTTVTEPGPTTTVTETVTTTVTEPVTITVTETVTTTVTVVTV